MTGKEKSGNLDRSISLVRCVAMVFIITCHFCQFYGNELAWWLNVGVQVFFCVSGFLYGNKRIDDPIGFLWKNFKKILVPYFTFLIPSILMYFVFAREHISVMSAVKAVLCSDVIDGLGHLWFISYILFCYVITPFLYRLIEKIKDFKLVYVLFTMSAILVAGQVIFYTYKAYFMFSRICCYIIGYFLAFILKRYENAVFKWISYVVLMGAVLSNTVRLIIKYYLKTSFVGIAFFEQYSHLLLGIAIFVAIKIFLKNIRYNKVLELSDKYSYYVYIVHQALILSPFSLMGMTEYMYLNWALVLLGIFALAVVLKLVSDKVMLVINKAEERILMCIK